jgi:hypothetical protein
MRFFITVALSLAATVSAAPQRPDFSILEARQGCVVDCTCLNADRTRSWPDTQRCCVPNSGTLDVPVCTLPSRVQDSPVLLTIPPCSFTLATGINFLPYLTLLVRPNTAAVSRSTLPRPRPAPAAAKVVSSNAGLSSALSRGREERLVGSSQRGIPWEKDTRKEWSPRAW